MLSACMSSALEYVLFFDCYSLAHHGTEGWLTCLAIKILALPLHVHLEAKTALDLVRHLAGEAYSRPAGWSWNRPCPCGCCMGHRISVWKC